MILTPWFPKTIKPVREGWYETRWSERDHFPEMYYWEKGTGWTKLFAGDQHREWRGILVL